MKVWRDGKKITLAEGKERVKITFTKTHEAAQYRNAISLENKRTFAEALVLIRRYNGTRIV